MPPLASAPSDRSRIRISSRSTPPMVISDLWTSSPVFVLVAVEVTTLLLTVATVAVWRARMIGGLEGRHFRNLPSELHRPTIGVV